MPPIDRLLALHLTDELLAIVEPALAAAENRAEARAVLLALAAVSASAIGSLRDDEPLVFFLDRLKGNFAHVAALQV